MKNSANLGFCVVYVQPFENGKPVFNTNLTYRWKGQLSNEKTEASKRRFAEQLRKARLTVLYHDGAIANCRSDIEIDGTYYVSWIWLKDLQPCL